MHQLFNYFKLRAENIVDYALINRFTQEMSILAFTSLIFQLVRIYGFWTVETVLFFDFLHQTLIFFLAFYAVFVLYVVALRKILARRFAYFEQTVRDGVFVDKSCLSFLQPSFDLYRGSRNYLFQVHNLPSDFPFLKYICQCMNRHTMELITVEHMFGMILFVFFFFCLLFYGIWPKSGRDSSNKNVYVYTGSTSLNWLLVVLIFIFYNQLRAIRKKLSKYADDIREMTYKEKTQALGTPLVINDEYQQMTSESNAGPKEPSRLIDHEEKLLPSQSSANKMFLDAQERASRLSRKISDAPAARGKALPHLPDLHALNPTPLEAEVFGDTASHFGHSSKDLRSNPSKSLFSTDEYENQFPLRRVGSTTYLLRFTFFYQALYLNLFIFFFFGVPTLRNLGYGMLATVPLLVNMGILFSSLPQDLLLFSYTGSLAEMDLIQYYQAILQKKEHS
jgi:hypothetical protein